MQGLTVHNGHNDPNGDEEVNKNIGLSPPRRDQRAAEVRDHVPVESKESHSKTTIVAEKLVDNRVAGCDPAHPIEHTQRSEDVSGEEVVYRRS